MMKEFSYKNSNWYFKVISLQFFQFVDLMARKLKDALKSCMWKTARYVVRFFADLVNCHVISTNSLLELYQSFLDTAREDNAPQGNHCTQFGLL